MKTGLEIAEEVVNAINVDYESKSKIKYFSENEIKEKIIDYLSKISNAETFKDGVGNEFQILHCQNISFTNGLLKEFSGGK